MKKHLLTLMLTVAALFCAYPAVAQSWSTTVKWSVPGSIEIKKGTSFSSATPVDIPAGATELTLTEATGYFIIAAQGYEITSGDLNGTKKTPGLVDYSSGVKGISIRAQYASDKDAYNGKTLVVDVVKLEYKDFNLEVANGASGIVFKFYNNGSEVSTLSGVADGKNSLKFPTTANQLFIQSSSFPREGLYSVKLEGIEQAEYNTLQHSYLVPLSEGCNVYVAKTEPAAATNYDVTFKFTNNNPGVIATIRDVTASKFIYPEEFGAAGYKLTVPKDGQIWFNWNKEANIQSLTANGTDVTVTAGKTTKCTITANTEFVITASMIEYPEKTVQLYLTDAEHASFTANNEKLDLTYVKDITAGSVTLPSGFTINTDCKLYEAKILEKPSAGISFEPNSGYWVKQGVRGTLAGAFNEAADKNLDGASKIMLENTPLFLDIAKINNSAKAYVYYQGPDNAGKLQSSSPDGTTASYVGQTANLPQGWSEIQFDPEYNAKFTARIAITFDNQNWVKTVVLDGTAIGADENDNYNMPFSGTNTGNEDGTKVTNGKMVDNSVLKMFFTPSATPAYYTTLNVEGAASAEVTYDMCKTISLTENKRLTNYGPTPFSIKPAPNVVVELDGVAQTPDAEGNVTFTVTKKSTITIKENLADATLEGTLNPEPGTTVRSLKTITFSLPFDGEHAVMIDPESVSLITLTPTASAARAAAEPIHATSAEAGEPSETAIPVNISFPVIAEAGQYTLDIPAGIFYQTAYDEASDSFTFQPGCKTNKAVSEVYTVNPDKPYVFSFNPANGSTNPFPEEAQIIVISVDDASSLEAPATTTAGPWVKFNGLNVKHVDDADTETGWSWTETAATYGKPALAMLISKNVFTTVGTLEINADANAFTIDGKTTSPEIAYSAQFGEKKNYTVTYTPAQGSAVPSVAPEFKITFEGAKSLAVDQNNFDAYFRSGLAQGIQIFPRMVTTDGNTATIKLENEDAFPVGNYILEILEGSFIIDGNQTNGNLNAAYVIERSTDYSQTWTPNPTGGVINYGSGMGVAFVFGADETVTQGENIENIKATFNNTELVPYDPSLPQSTMWYRVEFDDYMPNAILISAGGGEISESTTSGTLTVTLPAGAINISGTPLAQEATHSWNLLPYRDYAMTVEPADGTTVKELKSITITFPDATTADLSEYYHNGNITIKKGYEQFSRAKSCTKVEDAEKPTFIVEFETPATEAGNYSVSIGYGAFILDGTFESDRATLDYTVDPNLTGIDYIISENGLYTVVSLQGYILLRDADIDAVKALPAGYYIVNGKKVRL